MACTKDGKVLYRLKRPFKDGSTHVVFEPPVHRVASAGPSRASNQERPDRAADGDRATAQRGDRLQYQSS